MSERTQDTPAWAKAALNVKGVGIKNPIPDDWDGRCDSCGQSGICHHPHDQVVDRLNESRVCLKCNQLLHGSPTKDEERCASCGRLWGE